LPADAHFAWDVPSQGLNSLRKKSGPGNDRQGLNRLRKKSQPLQTPPPGLKPSIQMSERFRGFKNPLPRTEVRGFHPSRSVPVMKSVFFRKL
jgi:hypothetical protein